MPGTLVAEEMIEQLAERVRLLIWEDMRAGRVAVDIPSYSALIQDAGARDYLGRAGLRADGPHDRGAMASAAADDVIRLVDSWIQGHRIGLHYGAFTDREVAMLRHRIAGIEKHQNDVRVVARIAGEWLAGVHSTMSNEEHHSTYGPAVLALAHDVLHR